MKLRWWILSAVVVVVGIVILAAPNLLFHALLGKPSRSAKVPEYYKQMPHYLASQDGRERMKTAEVEDLTLTSRDGLQLHGYFYPAEQESKKFVLFVHGYRSYARAEIAPFFEFYHDSGFNILAVDDRAHAPSEGEYIGFGVLDRLDCVDWAKKLVELHGEDIQILLHGVSMGGATVLSASGEAELPEQVQGVVSDCGFSSAWEIIGYQLKEALHLPAGMLPRLEKVCQKKAGYDFHEHAAIDQVKQARVPILFVHGELDTMVPVHMARDLYEACTSEKELLLVPEAAHGESIAFAREQYEQTILDFFKL